MGVGVRFLRTIFFGTFSFFRDSLRAFSAGLLGSSSSAMLRLKNNKQIFVGHAGQAVVEYILILSLVAVGSATMTRFLLRTIDSGIARLGGQMSKDIKTGRASLGSWKN